MINKIYIYRNIACLNIIINILYNENKNIHKYKQ